MTRCPNKPTILTNVRKIIDLFGKCVKKSIIDLFDRENRECQEGIPSWTVMRTGDMKKSGRDRLGMSSWIGLIGKKRVEGPACCWSGLEGFFTGMDCYSNDWSCCLEARIVQSKMARRPTQGVNKMPPHGPNGLKGVRHMVPTAHGLYSNQKGHTALIIILQSTKACRSYT